MIGDDDHVGIGRATASGAGDFARVPRDRFKLILGAAGQAAANTDAENLGDGIRSSGVAVRIVQEVDPVRFLRGIEPLACGFGHTVGEEIDRVWSAAVGPVPQLSVTSSIASCSACCRLGTGH